MALAVVIGNDTDDLRNIEDTIKILTLTKESYDTPLGDRLETIIDWYNGIYKILTDADMFAMQT